MQLTADIFGLPTAPAARLRDFRRRRGHRRGGRSGLHRDFDAAVTEMTRVSRVFEPNPANRDLYDRLYERVYKRMYRQLRRCTRKSAAVTGYPPKV